jgi:hypothetical protein
MATPPNSVFRDGFEFGFDRFYALPYRIDRVDAADLRRMFLPKLTPEAKKMLRESFGRVVPAQLKHYGIEFKEADLKGNGTNFQKTVIAAGKVSGHARLIQDSINPCFVVSYPSFSPIVLSDLFLQCDKVPEHIERLHLQMADEWYGQMTLEDMAAQFPEKIAERHFLNARGEPDRSKTTGVLVVPLPPGSTYRAGLIRQSIDKVEGLYHETHRYHGRNTLFVGWDRDSVHKAANGHAEVAKKELEKKQHEQERKQRERKEDRAAMHQEYLRKSARRNQRTDPQLAAISLTVMRSRTNGRTQARR